MIKVEHIEVWGWEHAIRGMRNPMNSWDKSDTVYGLGEDRYTDMVIGPNDLSHAKAVQRRHGASEISAADFRVAGHYGPAVLVEGV